MGHTSHSAIVLAVVIITFTSGEISPKMKKLEYIYDKESNRRIGYIVIRVQPLNSKFQNHNEDRNEKKWTEPFETSPPKKFGVIEENKVDRTDVKHENNADLAQNNYQEDQQAEATNNEEILAHHLREDVVKTLTIVKKVPVPFPVENTIHYPVVKNVPYMVKVPVPAPYAVERKIPVPFKVFVKVPVKIPKPVPVFKKTPYPVHVAVERPVPVKVFIPNPYPVEKKIPYEVKVPVPQPYPVERKIPVPVKFTEKVPQPFPVEKVVHYPIKIEVQRPVPVPVLQPYAVPVAKNVPYFVDKHVPVPVKVEVEKHVPYPVEKPVPVPVLDYSHEEGESHDHIPEFHEHK